MKMKKGLIVLIVVVAVVLILFFWIKGMYNTMVRMDETQLKLDDDNQFDINNVYQLKHSYSAMAIFRNYKGFIAISLFFTSCVYWNYYCHSFYYVYTQKNKIQDFYAIFLTATKVIDL